MILGQEPRNLSLDSKLRGLGFLGVSLVAKVGLFRVPLCREVANAPLSWARESAPEFSKETVKGTG
jgi:hypothetical protein